MSSSVAYRKRWQLDVSRGVDRSLTDLGPVVEHLGALLDAGLSASRIGRLAGVSPTTVRRCVAGHYEHLQQRTARRLLAVSLPHAVAAPVTHGRVPAVGARRRIAALLALGWTHQHITAAMRTTGTHQRSALVLRQPGDQVEYATWAAIAAAYDDLSMTPGPSRVTARRAAALEYAPPLAWDDDTIDDPAATPNLGAPPADARHDDVVDDAVLDRVLSGIPTATTSAERAALIPVLAARHMSDREIAALCRTTDRTIQRTRVRLGVRSQWGAAA
ncbi:hypothetical protein [Cellulomonas iranensis]|uniref:hypothetical protein n=1 Tax=Cellulomonas iranensis TaxID=76862 RepID=UPI001178BE97|nr:hypothetical protein [Cellulomonas iranensis]